MAGKNIEVWLDSIVEAVEFIKTDIEDRPVMSDKFISRMVAALSEIDNDIWSIADDLESNAWMI